MGEWGRWWAPVGPANTRGSKIGSEGHRQGLRPGGLLVPGLAFQRTDQGRVRVGVGGSRGDQLPGQAFRLGQVGGLEVGQGQQFEGFFGLLGFVSFSNTTCSSTMASRNLRSSMWRRAASRRSWLMACLLRRVWSPRHTGHRCCFKDGFRSFDACFPGVQG